MKLQKIVEKKYLNLIIIIIIIFCLHLLMLDIFYPNNLNRQILTDPKMQIQNKSCQKVDSDGNSINY